MDNLKKFLDAQDADYTAALSKLKAGRKESHWIWYIFPQIEGLGKSHMDKLYSIKSREEAELYLQHPVLAQRLITCTEAVLFNRCPVEDIFEYPDNLKFKSSMTLFASISEPGSVFALIIDKCFNGDQDEATHRLLISCYADSIHTEAKAALKEARQHKLHLK